jgi:ribonuclease BN (tRNA processing enzyme)
VKLTVLGCAGSFPSASSACSSYLVEADGFRLLVDMGNGSMSALARRTDLYAVDAIVISHLHPDHWIDLCQYLVARKYAPSRTLASIPVFSPQGLAERIDVLEGASGSWKGVFDLQVLTPGCLSIGPFAVTARRMNHPVETYGFRIVHGDRALAYSADTAACDALVELARDADVFLCEASFLDRPGNVPNLHLTGREAGEHAAAAGAHRLLLTHLVEAWGDADTTLAEARSAYAGPIDIVRADQTFDL